MDGLMKYEHVLGFALEHPWAVTPMMRITIAHILARRIVGEEVDPVEIAAAMNTRKNLPQPTRGGAVALIPIYGVIAPRMNMFSEMSGGTTFETLTAQLHDALGNKDVKTIVFDVDSPGGNVAGATEFANEILKGRAQKPIIAVAQYLMASAAYWPMACATQVVAAPSAMVGSIGVYTMHNDISEALAKNGIKREVIGAGKFKTEGVDGGPLTEEARAHIKGLVEDNYGRMVADICKGRGVSASEVKNGYGEGRCLTADAAKALGMIDRIDTLAGTLARVMTSPPSASTTAQEPSHAMVTAQELAADAAWQSTLEGALLELDL